MPNPQKGFWEQVEKGSGSDDCWVWVGRTDKDGYGKYRFKLREHRASRWSYSENVGPLPPGMLVCHTCDNPPCVRPDHLFLGSPLDNSQDMIQKGRKVYTNPPPSKPRKVTPDVRERIFLLRSENWTQAAIGKAVGVTQAHVSRVLRSGQ